MALVLSIIILLNTRELMFFLIIKFANPTRHIYDRVVDLSTWRRILIYRVLMERFYCDDLVLICIFRLNMDV